MDSPNSFEPDWLSPPGETIRDLIDERRLTLAEFARQIGCSSKDATELLRGRASVTPEIAQKLATVLGSSPRFWLARESQYRADMVRLRDTPDSPEAQSWLDELPTRDMVEFGWVPPPSGSSRRTPHFLKFFDVAGVNEWRMKYRQIFTLAALRTSPSFVSRPGAVSAWLRQGEIRGVSIDCEPWNAQRLRGAIPDLRRLTRMKDPRKFLPELTQRCAACGVAVAIVRAPAGCRASGATRFISPDRALLLLSFRYLSDDQFWFTFFHELGHLLLHGETELFLEDLDASSDRYEKEANSFAESQIIPTEFRKELDEIRIDMRTLVRFAHKVGVSAGLVVGQLQHNGRIPQRYFNGLKVRYDWSTIDNG